jgi:hypothetical protein
LEIVDMRLYRPRWAAAHVRHGPRSSGGTGE